MRRLYYALPFLLIATGYVLWDFRETPAIIVLLNWLTFFPGVHVWRKVREVGRAHGIRYNHKFLTVAGWG